ALSLALCNVTVTVTSALSLSVFGLLPFCLTLWSFTCWVRCTTKSFF
ncbi:hypothetical protein M5D96_013849, partial [Drosophila gunungcola]